MRRKLELLLGAALAGGAAPLLAAADGPPTDAAPRTAPSRSAGAFVPPPGPMVLTRELRRTMGNDREIVTRRTYAVRFVPEGTGWRVDGTLTGSEVEAPAGVPAPLVELERNRRDVGLFPLQLNHEGLIVAQQGSRDPAAEARALSTVKAALAQSALAAPDRQLAALMADRLHAQAKGAGGNWPVDLFHPRKGEHSEVRSLPLGEGMEGRITVTIAAAPGPAGLVERFQRKVLTETGASRRLSVETWTLSRAR